MKSRKPKKARTSQAILGRLNPTLRNLFSDGGAFAEYTLGKQDWKGKPIPPNNEKELSEQLNEINKLAQADSVDNLVLNLIALHNAQLFHINAGFSGIMGSSAITDIKNVAPEIFSELSKLRTQERKSQSEHVFSDTQFQIILDRLKNLITESSVADLKENNHLKIIKDAKKFLNDILRQRPNADNINYFTYALDHALAIATNLSSKVKDKSNLSKELEEFKSLIGKEISDLQSDNRKSDNRTQIQDSGGHRAKLLKEQEDKLKALSAKEIANASQPESKQQKSAIKEDVKAEPTASPAQPSQTSKEEKEKTREQEAKAKKDSEYQKKMREEYLKQQKIGIRDRAAARENELKSIGGKFEIVDPDRIGWGGLLKDKPTNPQMDLARKKVILQPPKSIDLNEDKNVKFLEQKTVKQLAYNEKKLETISKQLTDAKEEKTLKPLLEKAHQSFQVFRSDKSEYSEQSKRLAISYSNRIIKLLTEKQNNSTPDSISKDFIDNWVNRFSTKGEVFEKRYLDTKKAIGELDNALNMANTKEDSAETLKKLDTLFEKVNAAFRSLNDVVSSIDDNKKADLLFKEFEDIYQGYQAYGDRVETQAKLNEQKLSGISPPKVEPTEQKVSNTAAAPLKTEAKLHGTPPPVPKAPDKNSDVKPNPLTNMPIPLPQPSPEEKANWDLLKAMLKQFTAFEKISDSDFNSLDKHAKIFAMIGDLDPTNKNDHDKRIFAVSRLNQIMAEITKDLKENKAKEIDTYFNKYTDFKTAFANKFINDFYQDFKNISERSYQLSQDTKKTDANATKQEAEITTSQPTDAKTTAPQQPADSNIGVESTPLNTSIQENILKIIKEIVENKENLKKWKPSALIDSGKVTIGEEKTVYSIPPILFEVINALDKNKKENEPASKTLIAIKDIVSKIIIKDVHYIPLQDPNWDKMILNKELGKDYLQKVSFKGDKSSYKRIIAIFHHALSENHPEKQLERLIANLKTLNEIQEIEKSQQLSATNFGETAKPLIAKLSSSEVRLEAPKDSAKVEPTTAQPAIGEVQTTAQIIKEKEVPIESKPEEKIDVDTISKTQADKEAKEKAEKEAIAAAAAVAKAAEDKLKVEAEAAAKATADKLKVDAEAAAKAAEEKANEKTILDAAAISDKKKEIEAKMDLLAPSLTQPLLKNLEGLKIFPSDDAKEEIKHILKENKVCLYMMNLHFENKSPGKTEENIKNITDILLKLLNNQPSVDQVITIMNNLQDKDGNTNISTLFAAENKSDLFITKQAEKLKEDISKSAIYKQLEAARSRKEADEKAKTAMAEKEAKNNKAKEDYLENLKSILTANFALFDKAPVLTKFWYIPTLAEDKSKHYLIPNVFSQMVSIIRDDSKKSNKKFDEIQQIIKQKEKIGNINLNAKLTELNSKKDKDHENCLIAILYNAQSIGKDDAAKQIVEIENGLKILLKIQENNLQNDKIQLPTQGKPAEIKHSTSKDQQPIQSAELAQAEKEDKEQKTKLKDAEVKSNQALPDKPGEQKSSEIISASNVDTELLKVDTHEPKKLFLNYLNEILTNANNNSQWKVRFPFGQTVTLDNVKHRVPDTIGHMIKVLQSNVDTNTKYARIADILGSEVFNHPEIDPNLQSTNEGPQELKDKFNREQFNQPFDVLGDGGKHRRILMVFYNAMLQVVKNNKNKLDTSASTEILKDRLDADLTNLSSFQTSNGEVPYFTPMSKKIAEAKPSDKQPEKPGLTPTSYIAQANAAIKEWPKIQADVDQSLKTFYKNLKSKNISDEAKLDLELKSLAEELKKVSTALNTSHTNIVNGLESIISNAKLAKDAATGEKQALIIDELGQIRQTQYKIFMAYRNLDREIAAANDALAQFKATKSLELKSTPELNQAINQLVTTLQNKITFPEDKRADLSNVYKDKAENYKRQLNSERDTFILELRNNNLTTQQINSLNDKLTPVKQNEFKGLAIDDLKLGDPQQKNVSSALDKYFKNTSSIIKEADENHNKAVQEAQAKAKQMADEKFIGEVHNALIPKINNDPLLKYDSKSDDLKKYDSDINNTFKTQWENTTKALEYDIYGIIYNQPGLDDNERNALLTILNKPISEWDNPNSLTNAPLKDILKRYHTHITVEFSKYGDQFIADGINNDFKNDFLSKLTLPKSDDNTPNYNQKLFEHKFEEAINTYILKQPEILKLSADERNKLFKNLPEFKDGVVPEDKVINEALQKAGLGNHPKIIELNTAIKSFHTEIQKVLNNAQEAKAQAAKDYTANNPILEFYQLNNQIPKEKLQRVAHLHNRLLSTNNFRDTELNVVVSEIEDTVKAHTRTKNYEKLTKKLEDVKLELNEIKPIADFYHTLESNTKLSDAEKIKTIKDRFFNGPDSDDHIAQLEAEAFYNYLKTNHKLFEDTINTNVAIDKALQQLAIVHKNVFLKDEHGATVEVSMDKKIFAVGEKSELFDISKLGAIEAALADPAKTDPFEVLSGKQAAPTGPKATPIIDMRTPNSKNSEYTVTDPINPQTCRLTKMKHFPGTYVLDKCDSSSSTTSVYNTPSQTQPQFLLAKILSKESAYKAHFTDQSALIKFFEDYLTDLHNSNKSIDKKSLTEYLDKKRNVSHNLGQGIFGETTSKLAGILEKEYNLEMNNNRCNGYVFPSNDVLEVARRALESHRQTRKADENTPISINAKSPEMVRALMLICEGLKLQGKNIQYYNDSPFNIKKPTASEAKAFHKLYAHSKAAEIGTDKVSENKRDIHEKLRDIPRTPNTSVVEEHTENLVQKLK